MVETETAPARRPDPRPALARAIAAVSAAGARPPAAASGARTSRTSPSVEPAEQVDEQPTVVASATPEPAA